MLAGQMTLYTLAVLHVSKAGSIYRECPDGSFAAPVQCIAGRHRASSVYIVPACFFSPTGKIGVKAHVDLAARVWSQ